jgi:HTH-type transcriptional regulator/antitoxin HigA
MTTATTVRKTLSDSSYMALVQRFPLRPIRSRRQYDQAAKMIDELAVRGEADLDAGEADYLSVLSDLIEAYDDEHLPILEDARPPYQKLRALVTEQGMNQSEVAELLEISRPLANLILNGRRELQKSHILRLAKRFKLEPGYFM